MKTYTTLLLIIISLGVYAQEAQFLGDFNTEGASSFSFNPEFEHIELNGLLLFLIDDGVHGTELWRTNGSETGTQMVKDIYPGEKSSQIYFFGVIDDLLYFAANDGVHGFELWTTQGTESSTQLVKDIKEGSSGSIPYSPQGIIYNGTLYFAAVGTQGVELFQSKGASYNTYQLKNINTGNNSYGYPLSSNPANFVLADYNIFFTAVDEEHGKELWRINTQNSEISMVRDITPGESSTTFREMLASGHYIYFEIVDDAGSELWFSTGEGNHTSKFYDFGDIADNITLHSTINGSLYFTVAVSFSDNYLWKCNGTIAGTKKIEGDLRIVSPILFDGNLIFYANGGLYKADGLSEVKFTDQSFYTGFSEVGDQLYFSGLNADNGNSLWRTDGTDEGTQEIIEISNKSYQYIRSLFAVGNQIYFIGQTDSTGRELWTSDGTAEGTYLLIDAEPGPGSYYYSSDEVVYASLENYLLFPGENETYGKELWKSDGTTEGTFMLKDINTRTSGSYFPGTPIEFNNHTFFLTQFHGLWRTDGSEENTILIKEIQNAKGLNVFKGKMYFSGYYEDGRYSIYESDGTTEGTLEFMSPDSTMELKASLTNDNPKTENLMFFKGDDDIYGDELWVTDGTEEGTRIVKDIIPGSDGSLDNLGSSIIVNNILYFSVYSSDTGKELWVSDATEEGTYLVRDINPFGSSYPNSFIEYKNEVFFKADDGTSKYELWKTNGTNEGTKMVKDLYPGDNDGVRSNLAVMGDWIYFAGRTPGNDTELWRSDGTEEGTNLFIDFGEDNLSSGYSGNPRQLKTIDDKLYFYAWDSTTYRFYTCDGTVEGTYALPEILPHSGIEYTKANDQIFFCANDEIQGFELWRVDKDLKSPVQMTDIAPGSFDSDPLIIGFLNGTIYFTADDNIHGRELWAISPLEMNVDIEQTFSSFCSNEDTVTFQAMVSNSITVEEYGWYLNDELINNDAGETFKASGFSEGEELKLKISADNSLWLTSYEVFSEPVILQYQLPNAEISISGTTLIASEGAFYQWYFDDEPLDENSREITATESGSYRVEVSNESGCSALSEAYNVILNNQQEDLTDLLVKTYPNPFNEKLFIDINTADRAEIKIFDMRGRLVIHEVTMPGEGRYEMDGSYLEAGIYMLQISSKKKSNTFKIIKK